MKFIFDELRTRHCLTLFIFAARLGVLLARAEEKFGNQRAHELRPEIEQIAADLRELAAAKIEFDDEP